MLVKRLYERLFEGYDERCIRVLYIEFTYSPIPLIVSTKLSCFWFQFINIFI
jgi:hypothetical protein